MIASTTLGVTANYPRTALVSILLVAKGMNAQMRNFRMRKKLKIVPYPKSEIPTERRGRSKGHYYPHSNLHPISKSSPFLASGDFCFIDSLGIYIDAIQPRLKAGNKSLIVLILIYPLLPFKIDSIPADNGIVHHDFYRIVSDFMDFP